MVEGTESERSAEEPNRTPRGQLDAGLKWLNDHAWPLAGVILVISQLHLHNYLTVEGIPISIASSALLTAIPAVFGKTALIVGVLTLLFLLPTVLLLAEVREGGSSLIDAMRPEVRPKGAAAGTERLQSSKQSRRVISKKGRGLAVRWIIGFVFYGLPLGASGFLVPVDFIDKHPWISSVVGLVVLMFFIIVFVWIVTRIPLSMSAWRALSPDFLAICGATAFVQFFLMTYVVDTSARVAGQYMDSKWLFLLALIVVLMVLAGMQLVGAIAVHQLRVHSQPSVVVIQVGIALVAFSSLAVEPSAAAVASMLKVKAPDGKDCVVLVKKSDAAMPNAEEQADGLKSRPVRILLEADGTYYARTFDARDREVILIAKGDVAKVSVCPGKPDT